MRLHPSVGLNDLLGKRGAGQNLRDQRIRIEGDRRDQLLQLFGSLWNVPVSGVPLPKQKAGGSKSHTTRFGIFI